MSASIQLISDNIQNWLFIDLSFHLYEIGLPLCSKAL